MLETDHSLIYVPEDDANLCRAATAEDVKIAHRMDALADLMTDADHAGYESHSMSVTSSSDECLTCSEEQSELGAGHRKGHCHCCHPCPKHWSYVELYSEHYRCAARNQLKVTRHTLDLGTLTVGTSIDRWLTTELSTKDGYAQAATLVRLPPGLRFSDDGRLLGRCVSIHIGRPHIRSILSP